MTVSRNFNVTGDSNFILSLLEEEKNKDYQMMIALGFCSVVKFCSHMPSMHMLSLSLLFIVSL
jgi:hypothetical protein